MLQAGRGARTKVQGVEERSLSSSQILERVYRTADKSKKRRGKRRRLFYERLRRNWQWKWTITLSSIAVAIVWALMHVHYYNALIDMEYNVGEAWAQVEAQLQKRHNIQANLTRISGTYARHEREVLTLLTKIRAVSELGDGEEIDGRVRADRSGNDGLGEKTATTHAPSGESVEVMSGDESRAKVLPPSSELDEAAGAGKSKRIPDIGNLASRIELVAEQYPQLMLSKNLQQYSAAIVETESSIAEKTMAYNKAVNIYSTALSQFPSNIFGWMCGFRAAEFYRPEREALSLDSELPDGEALAAAKVR